MKYQITSDNIEVTPSMEVLTREKFARVENRLSHVADGSKHIRVVLDKGPADKFSVRAVVNANGKEYFSDETDYSLDGALIKTVEEIVRMLEKPKRTEKEWGKAREEKRARME